MPVGPSFTVSPPVNASGTSPTSLPLAIVGAFTPFADPALIAPDAPIWWLTDAETTVLDAQATRAPAGTTADLTLADLPCIRHVVIGPTDAEHLLIHTSARSLTLRLSGHRASQTPVCLTFLVPARSRVKQQAAILALLPDLLSMKPRWIKRTRDQELIRDAFIAFDGRSVGASHREVAEVIHGIKDVRDEWSGRGGRMKERVRRALAKGQELCDGGHWRLVERACRFKS